MKLNAVQVWGVLGSLGLLLGACALPWRPLHQLLEVKTKLLPLFRNLAGRKTCAILLVGLIAFLGDAAVSWWRPPQPVVPDEFSYLLAADTFAAGRLTNPTPPQWQHFETPEVLVRPTYQSKYPPGQGLFLAAGQLLAGDPLVGVWLSSAFACMALCWMLQAWAGEAWALYGALLAAFDLAFFGHWAQSYWGGMVAALGGALLYGSVRRLAQREGGGSHIGHGLLAALGLVILANTRPFEGLLAAAPALLALGLCVLRNPARGRLVLKVALPSVAVLLLGGLAMLVYNRDVTGQAWRLPYQAYEQQYDAVPTFIFQHLRPWPQLQDASMRAAAVDTLAAWRWAHGFYRLAFLTSKLFGFWQFAFGAVLSLPFLLMVWVEVWPRTIRILQVVAFAAVQGLAVERFLFWPSPKPLSIAVLAFALLLQAALLVRYFPEFWERVALSALGLVALGVALETWRFHSHYIAPVLPLAILLVVQAIRRASVWTRHGRAPGKILAMGIPVLSLALAAAASTGAPSPLQRWAEQRTAMEKRLQSLPGKQLVIVHYGPSHDSYREWVENRADLESAKVVWARERSAEENCRLIESYPGRTLWRLDADREELQKYTPDCTPGQEQRPPTVPVLESLPDR